MFGCVCVWREFWFGVEGGVVRVFLCVSVYLSVYFTLCNGLYGSETLRGCGWIGGVDADAGGVC